MTCFTTHPHFLQNDFMIFGVLVGLVIGQDKNKTQGRWTVIKLLVYMLAGLKIPCPWPLVIAWGGGGGGRERQKSFHTIVIGITIKPAKQIPSYYGHPIIKDSLLCPCGKKP